MEIGHYFLVQRAVPSFRLVFRRSVGEKPSPRDNKVSYSAGAFKELQFGTCTAPMCRRSVPKFGLNWSSRSRDASVSDLFWPHAHSVTPCVTHHGKKAILFYFNGSERSCPSTLSGIVERVLISDIVAVRHTVSNAQSWTLRDSQTVGCPPSRDSALCNTNYIGRCRGRK